MYFSNNKIGPETPSTAIFSDRSLKNFNSISAISAPFYSRDLPPGGIDYTKNNRTWLCCSISNCALFSPLFFLWLPALVSSILAKKKYKNGNYIDGKKHSKNSLGLNIACFLLGLVIYSIVAVGILYYLGQI